MSDIWKNIKNFSLNLKDLSHMQIANFSSAGILAFFWFYVASILGSEQYGEIHYYIATANLISLIVNFGASSTLTVYVAKKIQIQSILYLISLITSIVGALFLFVITSNFGASLLSFGLVISSITSSEILGNKLYGNYTKYLLLQKFLSVSLAFLFYFLIDYSGIIIGLALSHFVYVKRLYNGFRESRIDFSLLKPRFRFMMNSYSINLIATVGSTADKLLIAPLLGFALLGNYVLGLQFLALITLFSTTVFEYVTPQYASGISNNRLRMGTILLSTILAFLGVVLSPFVVPIFFPEYPDSIEVIQILSLLAIPQTIIMMYNARFIGNEKTKYVVISTIIGLSIQVPAIILLGRIFEINGVALGMLLASTGSCIYLIFENSKMNKKESFK